MDPLLTIVIANYNYGRFLEMAIRSVLDQGVTRVELIIIDGGSTDESVDIIKRYETRLAYWCSERDQGQSNAFNKGFARARGKYLTWLNADDVLVPGCLAKIVAAFDRHPECEWFTANFLRATDDGRVMRIGWGPHYYPFLLQRTNSPVVAFGPSTFFAKALWERTGRVDERFHLAMDTEMWIRFISLGIKQRRIRCFCWAFRMHELSKTAEFADHQLSQKTQERFQQEDKWIKEKTGYVPSRMMKWGVRFWRIIDGSFLRLVWFQVTFRKFEWMVPESVA